MQLPSAFRDMTKLANFLSKNADGSRAQAACHVIYILLDFLYLRCNCEVSSVWDMFKRF